MNTKKLDELVKTLNEVTPVQEDGGVLYKMDFLYAPFDNSFATGGKLRQSVALFDLAREEIAAADIIITPTSVVSPQGPIVVTLADLVGKKSMLVIGNKHKDVEKLTDKHRTLKYCVERNCELEVVSALGFNTVLHSNAYKIAKERNGFVVSFGINSEKYKKAIIDSTGLQVQNMPRDLDHLVIPVGSGLTAAGILKAIDKLPKSERPKNIELVQIAGYDRVGVIQKELDFMSDLKYNFIKDETYPYSKLVEEHSMGGAFQMDERYESKAHIYMRKKIESGEWSGNIMYWVIGKIKNY